VPTIANHRHAIVVGAGSAGLAAAAELRREGLAVEVLDRAAAIGDTWTARYDALRLNTVRVLSGLPGLPIPRSYGRWLTRDDFAGYLRAYAEHHALTVHLGVAVTAVDREDGRWVVETATGRREADVVVLATGHAGRPLLPAWAARSRFRGRVLHAAEYRSPAAFAGADVLVVGAGNSGTEIALDLCGTAARVRLSVRTPPLLIPVEVHGLPMHLVSFLFRWVPWRVLDSSSLVTHRQHYADLAAHGLPAPKVGAYARFRQTSLAPVAERGFAAAVRDGRIGVVAAVERLEADAAVLADGERLAPDAVIVATGYEPAFAELVGLPDAFDREGRPVAWGGPLPGAPGLFVVGAPSLLGDLYEHGREARRVRQAVRRLLRAGVLDARPAAARTPVSSAGGRP